MILKENFYFFNYFEGLQPQNLHFIQTFFKKIHAAIFTFSDICVTIVLSKVRTPFDRIKKTKDCNYCYAPGIGKYWSEI